MKTFARIATLVVLALPLAALSCGVKGPPLPPASASSP